MLNREMHIMHKGPWICDICGDDKSTNSTLNYHRKTVHQNDSKQCTKMIAKPNPNYKNSKFLRFFKDQLRVFLSRCKNRLQIEYGEMSIDLLFEVNA